MSPSIAVVDYGVGNLFSIARACALAGLSPTVTSNPHELATAKCLVLPGIGAFGDAMAALQKRGLVNLLRELGRNGVPIVGVCLGMQLLMEQSHEFGTHEGLGLIPGSVEPLAPAVAMVKTPHVGWSRLERPRIDARPDPWQGTLLEGTVEGTAMYFVHSYRVVPSAPSVTLAITRYGGLEFCAAIRAGALTGFQFHPERSGAAGLQVYRNLAAVLGAQSS